MRRWAVKWAAERDSDELYIFDWWFWYGQEEEERKKGSGRVTRYEWQILIDKATEKDEKAAAGADREDSFQK